MPTTQDLDTAGFIAFNGSVVPLNQVLEAGLITSFGQTKGTMLVYRGLLSENLTPTEPALTEGWVFPTGSV